MMLYVIRLVLIISVMIEANCQTSISKDIIPNTFASIEANKPDSLAALNKPVIKEPKIYCADLPAPIANGWIDTTENLPLKMSPVGRSIIYRCNENTKQIGASSATCNENGRWSNTPPDCLSPCIVPVVRHSVSESSGATVSHGGKFTFECIDSYQPGHGLATSICNNGTWNVIPRCEPGPRENCDIPEIPKGMFVQLNEKNVTNNQTYVVGTQIVYKCGNPNNRLVDDIGLEAEYSLHVCDAETRKWKGTLSKCEPTCASLIHFTWFKQMDTDEPKLNIIYDGTVLMGERYKVGTKALIYCKPAENVTDPTAIANNSTFHCRSDGAWHGGFPSCVPYVAGRMNLSTIISILFILSSALMFLSAMFTVCKKYGYFNRTPPNANKQTENDAPGMRDELLREIRQQSFYSLDETPAGGVHATIHRQATTRRPPDLAVQYSRERPTSQYGKLG